jgi:hypothetical protein
MHAGGSTGHTHWLIQGLHGQWLSMRAAAPGNCRPGEPQPCAVPLVGGSTDRQPRAHTCTYLATTWHSQMLNHEGLEPSRSSAPTMLWNSSGSLRVCDSRAGV